MAKQDLIELTGTVVEVLPNTVFKVKIDKTENIVIGRLAGKLRINHIKIVEGDRVNLELSLYDLTNARITYRYR